jgi:hypothetical protein
LARSLQRGSKNKLWQLALSDVRGPLDARLGAKSIGQFAMQRKSDAKICIMSRWFIKIGSRTSIVLFGAKTEPVANPRHETTHQTDHGPFGGCMHSTSSERQAKPSPV